MPNKIPYVRQLELSTMNSLLCIVESCHKNNVLAVLSSFTVGFLLKSSKLGGYFSHSSDKFLGLMNNLLCFSLCL